MPLLKFDLQWQLYGGAACQRLANNRPSSVHRRPQRMAKAHAQTCVKQSNCIFTRLSDSRWWWLRFQCGNSGQEQHYTCPPSARLRGCAGRADRRLVFSRYTVTRRSSGDNSVRDKLSSVEIPEIKAPNGTPDARLAVSVRNALLYDFNGGANPVSPTHRLTITMASGKSTVIVDVTSGRPETEVENINATLTLTEIATNKVVMTATTFSRASFDIPGSAQRFAAARAARNSEDRAVDLLAAQYSKPAGILLCSRDLTPAPPLE